MAEVKFLTPQGTEITRDIQSPEQISGFEKSGFKTVSNPFTAPVAQPTAPVAPTPNYGGLSNVSPAEQDLFKQGFTPQQIELRRQQSSQGGRIDIGQAGQAVSSNLANYGIATSALPSIQSRADLMSAQEEAQIRQAEEQRKQMLRQQIASDFQGVINRTEKQGEQQIGGAEAQLGISRGLGASSSRMQLVNQMQSDINRDVAELEKAKIAALAKLDFDSADRTEALINQKIEQRGKLQEEAFNQSMRLLQEGREQKGFDTEQRKAAQEILEGNLDVYSSSLVQTDEEGNLTFADDETINSYAEQLGVPPTLLKARMSQQAQELSKLSQEERKRELDIMNAERQIIPQAFQEYEYAKNTLGYSGDFFEYLAQKEQVETSMPMSYKEWQLAGAPGEFANWLKSSETAPPKQFQYNAANYATRAEASNEIITGLESQFTGVKSYVGQVLPNFLKSSERQQLEQAQRNFVNAVLRRESGAVISDSEFNNAAKQYFPQPGDSTKVLEQKRANRELVVRNFINEAGSAIADTSPDLLNKYMQKATTYTDVLDFGTRATQQELTEFNQLKDLFPDKTPEEVFDFYQNESFNQPLSMGVKSSDVSKIKDGSRVTTTLGSGVVTGIQQGSSKWKWGFDFVLAGGKGASVPAPFTGTVTFAGKNKGFGNQVKIKLADGREIWLSHLDAVNVKPGQKITKGMVIGKQGNTGALLSGSGQELTPQQIASGRGTHIDITVKKPSGGYLTSKEVASLLGTRLNQA